MDEKFQSYLLKAPSKKTSSPASYYDKYVESLRASVDPDCQISLQETDDDSFLEFRRNSEDKEARRCLFPFNFSGFHDIEFDFEDVDCDEETGDNFANIIGDLASF